MSVSPDEFRTATAAEEAEVARIRSKFPDLDGGGSSGALARRKGAAGEREVVALLHFAGWTKAARTGDGRPQSGRGDIARGPRGVHIEVRRRERTEIWAWLDDAERAAGPGKLPVVCFRRSRSGWYAALPFDELLALLRLREAA